MIPEDLRDAFREIARFRNLAVYQTAILRDEIVHQVLQEDLGDFDRFLAAVARGLEESELVPADAEMAGLAARQSHVVAGVAAALEQALV